MVLNLLANTLSKSILLDVICKTHGCIPLLTFLFAVAFYGYHGFLWSHRITIIMQKHLSASKPKMEFQKGRKKRGIAVLYLFEHSLIPTHLSKFK